MLITSDCPSFLYIPGSKSVDILGTPPLVVASDAKSEDVSEKYPSPGSGSRRGRR